MQQKGGSCDKFHQRQCVKYSPWIFSLFELVAELKTIKSHASVHKLLQASGTGPLSIFHGTMQLIKKLQEMLATRKQFPVVKSRRAGFCPLSISGPCPRQGTPSPCTKGASAAHWAWKKQQELRGGEKQPYVYGRNMNMLETGEMSSLGSSWAMEDLALRDPSSSSCMGGRIPLEQLLVYSCVLIFVPVIKSIKTN